MAVLAFTARLAYELAFALGLALDGFSVSNLRLADIRFHLEFTQKPVYYYFQMQLAHTSDDGLPRFEVGVGAEGGVFFGEFGEGYAHLLLPYLGLGLYRNPYNGFGELHLLENYGVGDIANGVARRDSP